MSTYCLEPMNIRCLCGFRPVIKTKKTAKGYTSKLECHCGKVFEGQEIDTEISSRHRTIKRSMALGAFMYDDYWRLIKMNPNRVYETVKKACVDYKLDALYEDYIIYLVGLEGLYVLQKNKLIETCGVVDGRQLYTLLSEPKTAVFMEG